jgi:hypothetical protein
VKSNLEVVVLVKKLPLELPKRLPILVLIQEE